MDDIYETFIDRIEIKSEKEVFPYIFIGMMGG